MQKLIISFVVDFEDYSVPERIRPHGPYFHRWFPDGEKDALTINTGHPNTELNLYFVRKGRVEGGSIVYDHDKNEIDENIMARQAVLDAGPLFGKLILSNISEVDIEVLQQDRINDPRYLDLGKNIYGLLYPVLSITTQGCE